MPPEFQADPSTLSKLYVRATSGTLVPLDTVATPLLLKVIVVGEPKGIGVPLLSVTVGAVTGLAELLAPEKIRLLGPA